jgi:creatinine amidohydrolase
VFAVPPIHFAELTTLEADEVAAGARTPVLLLPVGAVEPHGPHAPLGTDLIIASGISERAAGALARDAGVHALVLPPIPYGLTRYAAAFRGAIHVEEATLHALVVDVCRAVAANGFPRVAIVNHHFEPEQVATLRRAVQTLHEHGQRGVGLLELTRRRNAERLTEEFRRGSCHAGRYETSLVLRDRPELVDSRRLPTLPALDVDMPAAMAAGRCDFPAMGMDAAYCGAPAEATPEEGEASFAVLTDLLVELVRALGEER